MDIIQAGVGGARTDAPGPAARREGPVAFVLLLALAALALALDPQLEGLVGFAGP